MSCIYDFLHSSVTAFRYLENVSVQKDVHMWKLSVDSVMPALAVPEISAVRVLF
jgi:hypothetical protein